MTREETAIELFNGDYNCAQSVIGAYKDLLGKKQPLLTEIASGFGGGMGRIQLTCGAITGSFMVLNALLDHHDEHTKDQLNKDMQWFASQFQNKFGDLNCRNLIKYDLKTVTGREEARANNVYEEKCTAYIRFAITLLDQLLASKTK